ncbi:MAG: hypothetical protein ACLQT6_17010 [Desulfomonilaceae bacterium]
MNKVLLFAVLCLIIATEAVNVTSSCHYGKNRQGVLNNLVSQSVGLRFKAMDLKTIRQLRKCLLLLNDIQGHLGLEHCPVILSTSFADFDCSFSFD